MCCTGRVRSLPLQESPPGSPQRTGWGTWRVQQPPQTSHHHQDRQAGEESGTLRHLPQLLPYWLRAVDLAAGPGWGRGCRSSLPRHQELRQEKSGLGWADSRPELARAGAAGAAGESRDR